MCLTHTHYYSSVFNAGDLRCACGRSQFDASRRIEGAFNATCTDINAVNATEQSLSDLGECVVGDGGACFKSVYRDQARRAVVRYGCYDEYLIETFCHRPKFQTHKLECCETTFCNRDLDIELPIEPGNMLNFKLLSYLSHISFSSSCRIFH